MPILVDQQGRIRVVLRRAEPLLSERGFIAMERVTAGKRVRRVVVKRSQSGTEDIQSTSETLPKINGKTFHTDTGHAVVDFNATKSTFADVPVSETSSFWVVPLNGSERDALSTLIPHQIPHQGNGAHASASAAIAEADTAPVRVTGTLADTSVVHAVRGRIRLRVASLKTSPDLGIPRLVR